MDIETQGSLNALLWEKKIKLGGKLCSRKLCTMKLCL